MRRTVLVGAVALLIAGCAPHNPVAGQVDGLVQIVSKPVDIGPGELTSLRLRGTRELSAETRTFGGFSALLIEDGQMLTVTDAGWLLEAPLSDTADGLVPGPARMTAMRGEGGGLLDKVSGDAEGLARLDGRIAMSFERDHRIMTLGNDGQLEAALRDRAFEALNNNEGLEALASLPGGALLAIGETLGPGGHPVFVLRDGVLSQGALPEAPPFSVTGADVGPDGRLYLVLRHYSPLTGVQIEIQRFALTAEGFPDPATRQRLAAYESASGIDNMEGISLWQDAGGATRLTLISDDNFTAVQRTLLMDFELLD